MILTTTPSGRRTCLLAIVAGALALSAPQIEAEGTPTSDDAGLVVQLEAWAATPRNLDVDYAFVGVGSQSGGGDVRSLGTERSTDAVLYAGWRLATSPGTELGMRFWEYEGASADTTGVFPQDVGPLLASPDLVVFNLVDSASAQSELRATRIDGGACWHHDLGSATRFDLEAGVRFFRFEETSLVSYRLEFGQVFEEFITASGESSGIGPRIAASYLRKMGRFRVGGSLGLAVAVGDVEGHTLDQFVIDGVPATDAFTEINRGGTRQAFVHLEGGLRFEVDLGAGWSATAGYAFQQWSGVRKGLRFVDEVGQNTTIPIDEDVVFEGFLAGVRFEF